MTTNPNGHSRRVERVARLQWVPLTLMRVSDRAQRDFNEAWANQLVAEFDPEQIGIFTVSKRAGFFWIIDGQHRKAVLEAVGWGDQQVHSEVYDGLTEAEEADMFLRRNNRLTITAYAKFTIGVESGRPEECAINKIVRSQGLRVHNGKSTGSVMAVGTLRRIYHRDGASVLSRTLGVAWDTYRDSGLEATVLDGIGLLLHRYDGDLTDAHAAKLKAAPGGVNALLSSADVLVRATARPRPQCIAAAAIEAINKPPRGRGFKKLAPWWQVSDVLEEV